MQIHRWRAGFQLLSTYINVTVYHQPTLLLVTAGFLFVLSSKFLPYILWGMSIVLPPLLLFWGIYHLFVAAYKLGAFYLSRWWPKR